MANTLENHTDAQKSFSTEVVNIGYRPKYINPSILFGISTYSPSPCILATSHCSYFFPVFFRTSFAQGFVG